MARERAIRAGLILGSLALGLIATEVMLRVVGFSFAFAPQSVEFGWPNPKVIRQWYRGEEDLFWVTKDYRQKLEGLAGRRPHVLFMGDSTTEFGKYPSIFLERVRSEHPDQEIIGEALGVGGWTTYQGLKQLKRDILPLRPRAITVCYGWNDHWIGFGIQDKEVDAITRSRLARFDRLRTVQLFLKAHLAYRARQTGARPNRVPREEFRMNLREITRLANENGIIPVLMTAPSSHEVGKEPEYLGERFLQSLSELVPIHQEYVSIVREVAASEQTVLCDLAQQFEALPSEEVRSVHFKTDGIHLTPEGNKKLSDFLRECFEEDPRLRSIWDEPG